MTRKALKTGRAVSSEGLSIEFSSVMRIDFKNGVTTDVTSCVRSMDKFEGRQWYLSILSKWLR